MNNLIRDIRSQITPSKKCLNDLSNMINGNEPAKVKHAGWTSIALPLATAVAAVFVITVAFGGGHEDDSEAIMPSASVENVSENPDDSAENKYPSGITGVDPTTEDGKFDLMHGGYTSTEIHSPTYYPDEETKLRLFKNNLDVEFAGINFHAVDENFTSHYTVNYVSEFIGMGKVKDNGVVYEIIIGLKGTELDKIILGMDDKFYEYAGKNISSSVISYYLNLDYEDWNALPKGIYDNLNSDYYLTDECYDSLVDNMQSVADSLNNGELTVDQVTSMMIQDDEDVENDTCDYYIFKEVCSSEEFDNNDLAGSGYMRVELSNPYDLYLTTYIETVANTPDENGDILMLLPGDRVIKMSRISSYSIDTGEFIKKITKCRTN